MSSKTDPLKTAEFTKFVLDRFDLVENTLQGPFDRDRFVYLTKNLLNHVKEDPYTYKGTQIFAAFADSIHEVERVGEYEGPDKKIVDILIVHLQKDTSLERARTKQRNFVAKYLKGGRGGVLRDAALVAFVAPNGEDWRFSLVKMEYTFSEKGKVQEEFTPARRYSFLVGQNENSHTAQSRLYPLLLDDKAKPSLEQLEEVFSVERVTKEFFEQYREMFLRFKDELDRVVKKDAKVRADFKEKGVDTVDFAKKLLGQIVFLYFLQKKGWFGVERGKEWGSGSKRFLRELFDREHIDYQNFFNDVLEPLFYEALRLERPGDYYGHFDCRIPFLNGGLFDPLGEYDWWDTDILLPDDLFSNDRKTKAGDLGDGLLDVFDRFNFTVKEDEPLEKDVAVDPEMLGKVFENLLEIKDRKSKGTYYTPREIVHYMCQESLANYLATELKEKVSREDIDTLIEYGETAVEHDSRVVNEGRETKTYAFKLPQDIRKHARSIDQALATIRVCDPAVGSGAFPVAMMHEIIRTRNALTPYMNGDDDRSPYEFKRHAIQNCLYGVDIDPGAIEIAKLRLWLSLVVDEEERDKVQPLPNLDYKIVQGNSLLHIQQNLFNQQLFAQLEELKQGFDVVIANPPYVKEYVNRSAFDGLRQSPYYQGKMDIWYMFACEGIDLLKPESGVLAFIAQNNWVTSYGATKMRHKVMTDTQILSLVDFGDYKVFETAGIQTMIMIFAKNSVADKYTFDYRQLHGRNLGCDDMIDLLAHRENPSAKYLNPVVDRAYYKDKKLTFSTPEAESVLQKIASRANFRLDPKKEVAQGIVCPQESVNKRSRKILGPEFKIGDGIFILSNDELKGLGLSKHEAELVKPLYTTNELGRWYGEKKNRKWIIYTDSSFKNVKAARAYPNIRKHLDKFRKVMTSSNKPYGLHRAREESFFKGEKIIAVRKCREPTFTYVDFDSYVTATFYVIKTDRLNQRYLTGLLNSKLIAFWLRHKGKMQGNNYQIDKEPIIDLPIYRGSVPDQERMAEIVDQIINLVNSASRKQEGTRQTKLKTLEDKCNKLAYGLYGLSQEEIEIVEGDSEA